MKILKTAGIAVLLCFLSVLSVTARDMETEDQRAYGFIQGVVSGYDGSSLIVNEGTKVNLKYDTKFFDSHGGTIGSFEIKEHKFIYVEGPLMPDKSIDAEKIYLLPGLIKSKDKAKYPFMQIP